MNDTRRFGAPGRVAMPSTSATPAAAELAFEVGGINWEVANLPSAVRTAAGNLTAAPRIPEAVREGSRRRQDRLAPHDDGGEAVAAREYSEHKPETRAPLRGAHARRNHRDKHKQGDTTRDTSR